jgi:antitoxin (DNA-binding transcriptional repressor) of toxin-antitoxin stability system
VIAPTNVTAFHDLRKSASLTHVFGRREWSDVRGITIHQTACVIGVTRGGQIMWLHSFDKLVVHGNGFNTQCIGVELDGLYEGVAGDPSTLWDDPSTPHREQGQTPTPELIEAARAAVRWAVAVVAANGGTVSKLVAHRQSSANRRNDPGSALWQAVALPMMEELGLSDGGPGFRIGGGREIPREWDPSRTGKY